MRRLLRSRPSSECRDPFDGRTSERLMGRAPTGQVWRDLSNSGADNNGIAAGQVYAPVTAGTRAMVETRLADGAVRATNAVHVNGNRLYLRLSDVPPATLANGLYVNAGTTSYQLSRVMQGASTVLGTYAATPANGDVVEVRLRGPLLELLVNGVSRLTAADGWNMGATLHGLAVGATTGRWDDFAVVRA